MADGSCARRIIIPYRPRPQFDSFHAHNKRWGSSVIHRRAGKTVSRVNQIIKRAVLNKRQWPPPKYAYVAPYYNQAKRIAWGYAKHYADPIPGREFNESELKITLPTGAEIRLFGADNPDALRGDYLDGLVADEYGDWDPSVWPLVIRPMLSDFKGWADFIGTPKGRNGFYDLHTAAEADPENWFTQTLKASESGIIAADELADIKRSMSEEQFAQEFECSFDAAAIGAYYGKEIDAMRKEGRIGNVPYDPSLKVWTAWDLGIGDTTSIVFAQLAGAAVHIIDYYEMSGVGLEHYARALQERRYLYELPHIYPHDAAHRDLSTGRERVVTLSQLGLPGRVLPATGVDDGIQATRRLLVRARVDEKKCARLIDALSNYRREYDEDKKAFKPKPFHNWASHAADAMRYLAMGMPERMNLQPSRTPRDGYSRPRDDESWKTV
jgi:phage terminase large subunit